MGTYKNYKCGYCGTSLTGGYQRAGALDNFTRCGPEFLHCFKCGKDNKTKFTPFNKMHFFERIWVYLILILSSILFGAIIPCLGLSLINVILLTINQNWGMDWDLITTISIYLAPLSAGVVIYFQIKSFRKDAKEGSY